MRERVALEVWGGMGAGVCAQVCMGLCTMMMCVVGSRGHVRVCVCIWASECVPLGIPVRTCVWVAVCVHR